MTKTADRFGRGSARCTGSWHFICVRLSLPKRDRSSLAILEEARGDTQDRVRLSCALSL